MLRVRVDKDGTVHLASEGDASENIMDAVYLLAALHRRLKKEDPDMDLQLLSFVNAWAKDPDGMTTTLFGEHPIETENIEKL